ncbi:DNA polymerase [Acetobacter tropicalis]|uniref:DNA polymerase n=1 Tax=Acetobacter tropicalis TaxID=104102 RepID=A0A149TZ79_9PROT|nr:uracil-DNA glycosylase [Acetobacter tropicalis]KXV58416.1 DNA polymerase [Acetobacter tropicalis]
MMDGALSLLRLYAEWGVDTAVEDTPIDHRLARLAPIPAYQESLHQGQGHQDVTPQRHSPHATPGIQPRKTVGTPAFAPAQRPPASSPTHQPAAGPALLADSVAQAHAVAAAATTPDSLRTALEQFDSCSLRITAMHTLFPEGPMHAPLMIIGEAPDADEDRSGHVFSGLSGTLLDQMLSAIGLTRDTLLLATALPWRPPGGRPPTDAERRICQPFLERAIALFAPQRLLLCGRLPAHLLTGTNKALPRRSWQPVSVAGLPAPVPALIMRHPLQLRASPTARKDIWNDLLLVAQMLQQNG